MSVAGWDDVPPDPSRPLAEAIAWLRDRVDDPGEKCPCCTQLAKVYHRHITSSMARTLIAMWRAAGTDWCNVPNLINRKGADEAKLRYWGLVEPQPGERGDGSTRTGWWRVTDKGRDYVHGKVLVPYTAHVYDSRCLGLHGDDKSIHDALGHRFNYRELMAGA